MSQRPVLQNFVILNAFGNMGSLYAADTLLAAGDTAGAASTLSSVSPNNQVEVNGLNYYGWLSRLKNGFGLNPGDKSEIYSLAESCPSIHGAVVFAARSLYDKVTGNHQSFFDNCPNNTITSKKKQGIQAIVAKKNACLEKDVQKPLVVYPNPSNGGLNINFPYKGYWQLSLIDNTGRVVWSSEFSGNTSKYKLANMKGIYKLVVKNVGSGISYSQTIVLQ